MSFWKVLKPNTPLTERLTNEWQNVGFQAKDPATDFRGAGFLGL
jgi:ELMO domain-containing protein